MDRARLPTLLREARRSFPFLELIIADAGCRGPTMEATMDRAGAGARDRAPL
jgi:hypothetical protein